MPLSEALTLHVPRPVLGVRMHAAKLSPLCASVLAGDREHEQQTLPAG